MKICEICGQKMNIVEVGVSFGNQEFEECPNQEEHNNPAFPDTCSLCQKTEIHSDKCKCKIEGKIKYKRYGNIGAS
jgi:hypothetical protein